MMERARCVALEMLTLSNLPVTVVVLCVRVMDHAITARIRYPEF